MFHGIAPYRTEVGTRRNGARNGSPGGSRYAYKRRLPYGNRQRQADATAALRKPSPRRRVKRYRASPRTCAVRVARTAREIPGRQCPRRVSFWPRLPAAPPGKSPWAPGAPLLPWTVPCAGVPGDVPLSGTGVVGVAPVPGAGVPGRRALGPVDAPGVSPRVPAPAGLLLGARGRELPDEDR